jgi:hypothetical protein
MNKKGAARNSALPEDAVTDGMKVTLLKINNSEYSLNPSEKMINIQGTNLIINLSEPLLPKSKIEAEMEWNFTIPPAEENPRMGVTDSAVYFLAYWYPKMAVYDDINGWDMHSYNGEHEFYFGYADYEVNISMPRGFIVWATGMPQNLQENLSDEILAKI